MKKVEIKPFRKKWHTFLFWGIVLVVLVGVPVVQSLLYEYQFNQETSSDSSSTDTNDSKYESETDFYNWFDQFDYAFWRTLYETDSDASYITNGNFSYVKKYLKDRNLLDEFYKDAQDQLKILPQTDNTSTYEAYINDACAVINNLPKSIDGLSDPSYQSSSRSTIDDLLHLQVEIQNLEKNN